MTGYRANLWGNFLIAEAGAFAALTGLLFVAVSINLEQILKFASLPTRAATTLIILVNVLIVATLGLVPGQSARALGAEILVVAVLVWGLLTRMEYRNWRLIPVAEQTAWRRTWSVVSIQFAAVPFIVCGVALLALAGGGLYWVIPGTLFSLVVAVSNAWVLLVEIQR